MAQDATDMMHVHQGHPGVFPGGYPVGTVVRMIAEGSSIPVGAIGRVVDGPRSTYGASVSWIGQEYRETYGEGWTPYMDSAEIEPVTILTADHAETVAREQWGGLYRVHRATDTDGYPDVWRVRLHAPDGPEHFIRYGTAWCHESHGCTRTVQVDIDGAPVRGVIIGRTHRVRFLAVASTDVDIRTVSIDAPVRGLYF